MTPPSTPNSENDLDYGPTLRGLREGLKMFGRYELIRMLGRGGMGVVWLARDTKLDLQMALKFLPEHLVHDEVALDDLRRETRRCLKLTHQNIVHVYDLVDDEATAAIAMEYVEGRTLSALRLEKPGRVFEPADILPWLLQVCEALEYAHTKAKIVHHDLKPGNLMLTSDSHIKVMDFGIASSIGDSISRVSKAGQQSSGGGTLPYMSPQQLMGFPPSVSDDVYSLGATIYELLTGKPPFFRGSLESQIQTLMPPTMTERRQELNVTNELFIPQRWEQLVALCLEKEAEKRPANAVAVWRGLHEPADFPVPPQAERPLPPPPRQHRPRVKEEPHLDTQDRVLGKKPFWHTLRHWFLWWVLGHALVAGLVCGLASLAESVSRQSVTVAESTHHAPAVAYTPSAAPNGMTLPNPGSALKWLLITSLTAQAAAHEPAVPQMFPSATPAPAAEVPPTHVEETAPEAGRVEWDRLAQGRIGKMILNDDPAGGLFLFVASLLCCLMLPALHYLALNGRHPWAGRFTAATAVAVAVSSLFVMLLANKTGFTMISGTYYMWYGLVDDWVKLPLMALFSAAAYFIAVQAPAKNRAIWSVAHFLGVVTTGIVLCLAVRFVFPDPDAPGSAFSAMSSHSSAEFFLLDSLAGATHGLVYGVVTSIGWTLMELNAERRMVEQASPN